MVSGLGRSFHEIFLNCRHVCVHCPVICVNYFVIGCVHISSIYRVCYFVYFASQPLSSLFHTLTGIVILICSHFKLSTSTQQCAFFYMSLSQFFKITKIILIIILVHLQLPHWLAVLCPWRRLCLPSRSDGLSCRPRQVVIVIIIFISPCFCINFYLCEGFHLLKSCGSSKKVKNVNKLQSLHPFAKFSTRFRTFSYFHHLPIHMQDMY